MIVIANAVLPHMLQALDHIASQGIIHRDVKPENILYVTQPDGQYWFQLGDFGLCGRCVDAAPVAGSRLYMAPEMFVGGVQTSKVGVWSLFVTMMWTLDTEDFRQKSNRFMTNEGVRQAVASATSNATLVSWLWEMAVVKSEDRASAAQMLRKFCSGNGLSPLWKHLMESSPR